MQGKVEISGVNTAKLKTLSNEEMMHLIELAQAGDEQAKQKLVEGNLKLVLSVIQRFMGRGENPDDLFQVGCIGLLKAIANFDTTKNVRFSTYGVPMIAGELRRYLRDYSPIRVSRSLRDTAYRVLQCRQQLTDQNGREPSIDEIAQALDLPPAQITAALDAITAPVSLYEPVYSEGGDALTVMDQVRDRKNTDEQWIESITLRDAVAGLSEREKRILALRFEGGRTQMEVAGQIGISQAQVSRLEKKRHPLDPQGHPAVVSISGDRPAYGENYLQREGRVWSTGFPSCAIRKSSTSARVQDWAISTTCASTPTPAGLRQSWFRDPAGFWGCSAETPTTSFPGAASAESGRISSSSKEPFRAGACCARNEGCSEASRARKKPENRKKF